ncbi:hypothetical protein HED60_03185 [Planctomycetales bacterium ZRK34]|nr:hypothetical protein HED60_03185 [Planctomycetales bacterium ZRK34]
MVDQNNNQARGGRVARWVGKRLAARAQRGALAMFRRAVRCVPAYPDILKALDAGFDPASVRNVADFQNVPATRKPDLFGAYPLSKLCMHGSLTDAVCIYTSSGFSGHYSFGAETYEEESRVRSAIDRMLDLYFDARRKQLLLINALPAGVRVPSRLATVVDTSTRPDAVLAIFKQLADEFDQVLLIAEHPFLKRVVEMGVDRGVDWNRYTVHAVTGAEVMPENFRGYLGSMLGHNLDDDDSDGGQTFVSLGISELSLSLGQETGATRRIRRLAAADAKLRSTLFGDEAFVPTFVQYDPRTLYLENGVGPDGRPIVLMTTLNRRRKIPLIRYTTDDWARVYSHEEVAALLNQCGRGDLIPRYPLPCLAMWGRGQCVTVAQQPVYPEQVKEAIYSDHDLAAALTGDFQMRQDGDRVAIRFQLNARKAAEQADVPDRLRQALHSYLPVDVDATLVAFGDFHHSVPLTYQHKRHYLESQD